MWTEVAENIKLAGGVPKRVAVTAASDYSYDPAAIADAITPATRAIFVNSPHNPTGAMTSVADARSDRRSRARARPVDHLRRSVRGRRLRTEHAHVARRDRRRLGGSRHQRLLVLEEPRDGGLRTGYLVTRSPLLKERIQKLLRCTINGVNSLAQWGALAAVTGPQDHLATMRAEYTVRRDLMIDALRDIPGVRAFEPRGAFYIWAELSPEVYTRLGVSGADELSARLAQNGIGSAPGDAFGIQCTDAIRFAFSCDTTMVTTGSALLRAALTGEETL